MTQDKLWLGGGKEGDGGERKTKRKVVSPKRRGRPKKEPESLVAPRRSWRRANKKNKI
jgi:hypothetical protein